MSRTGFMNSQPSFMKLRYMPSFEGGMVFSKDVETMLYVER